MQWFRRASMVILCVGMTVWTPEERSLILASNNDSSPCLDRCAVAAVAQNHLIANLASDDADQSWKAFGTPGMVVTTPGSKSAILGYVYNDLAPRTFALPAGINGYGKLAVGSLGNQVFGVYGLGELSANAGTAIGAEFTARNFAGPPDTNLPPDESIGTTTRSVVGLQVTAGGTSNSSIAVQIGPEGGSSVGFNTGIYLRKGSHARYGIFVEPQTSGTQISEYVGNNGSGINLVLKTSGRFAPRQAVVKVEDALGADHFSVAQNGDVYTSGHFYGTGGMPSVTSCGSSPSVTGHDSAGAISVGAGTVTACTLTFDAKFLRVPYCTTTPNFNVTLWVSAISTSSFTVSSSANMNSRTIYYNCQG